MAETSIEWTDATWNPVAGCTVLTAGCTNCYAMRMAARLDAMGQGKYRRLTRRSGGRAVWTGKIRLDEKSLQVPASWSKPRKVFVNSMSDLFHEAVPKEFIRRVWTVMGDTPRHTYQILTKRPDRMATILSIQVLAFCRMFGSAPQWRMVGCSTGLMTSRRCRLQSASYPSSL